MASVTAGKGEQLDSRANRPGERAPSLLSKFTAETAGTFVLTLVAAGADVLDAVTGGTIGHAARYLAPGLILVALIFAFSGISGAHFNPAVTLAFVARGVFPAGRAVAYVAFQFAGAVLAGGALAAVFGAAASHGATRMELPLSPAAGLATEAVLTAILVTIILGTSEERAIVGKNAALAVGFTVAACGLFASPISGASMNPARSFGPMLATLTFTDWWIYIAGPCVGALFAVGIVQLVYGSPNRAERDAADGVPVG
jgi:aquaporin Z